MAWPAMRVGDGQARRRGVGAGQAWQGEQAAYHLLDLALCARPRPATACFICRRRYSATAGLGRPGRSKAAPRARPSSKVDWD